MRWFLALLAIGWSAVAAAQVTPQSFSSFVLNAPLATTPLGPFDVLAVVQNGVTKRVAGPSLITGTPAVVTIVGGSGSGLSIGGTIVLSTDASKNVLFATNTAFPSVTIGSPSSQIILAGTTTASKVLKLLSTLQLAAGQPITDTLGNSLLGFSGTVLSVGAAPRVSSVQIGSQFTPTTIVGALALPALGNGGGGRCLGWNPWTHQVYVSLAQC